MKGLLAACRLWPLSVKKPHYGSVFDKVIAETEEYETHYNGECAPSSRRWQATIARLRKWANSTHEPKVMASNEKDFNKDWLIWKYWVSWPVSKEWVLERAKEHASELRYIEICKQKHRGQPEPTDVYANQGIDYIDWYMGNFPDPKSLGLDRLSYIREKMRERAAKVEYDQYLLDRLVEEEPPLMVRNPEWIKWYQKAHPSSTLNDILMAHEKARVAEQQRN